MYYYLTQSWSSGFDRVNTCSICWRFKYIVRPWRWLAVLQLKRWQVLQVLWCSWTPKIDIVLVLMTVETYLVFTLSHVVSAEPAPFTIVNQGVYEILWSRIKNSAYQSWVWSPFRLCILYLCNLRDSYRVNTCTNTMLQRQVYLNSQVFSVTRSHFTVPRPRLACPCSVQQKRPEQPTMSVWQMQLTVST